MAEVQTAEPSVRNTATFESVWAALDRLTESQKETDLQMKETDRQISRLGNRIGELIEHFAASNLLEDGEYAMVVEVKSLFNKNDVIEHQERMKIVREYADKRSDTRKYLAAIAGATIDGTAREYALESGIYVIEQTGDTVRVKSPPSLTYW